MNITVTDDAAVALDLSDYPDVAGKGQTLILQNLGDGNIFFDFLDDVTADSGIQLAKDGSYEIALNGQPLYLISDDTSDLRFTVVG